MGFFDTIPEIIVMEIAENLKEYNTLIRIRTLLNFFSTCRNLRNKIEVRHLQLSYLYSYHHWGFLINDIIYKAVLDSYHNSLYVSNFNSKLILSNTCSNKIEYTSS